MNPDDRNIITLVKQQYERFPYPVAIESLEQFISSGARQGGCPSLCFHWYWPYRAKTDDLDILIAGCGTSQAAKIAVNVPGARVTAIDISERSIEHTRMLLRKHGITNVELHLLPVEQVASLKKRFDLIFATGVLHHLADPVVGMTELRRALRTDGSIYVMLYGKYGRDGVYYLQELIRRVGLTAMNATSDDLDAIVSLINHLPRYHSFSAKREFFGDNMQVAEELVDLFLHPQDRGYSIPDIYDLLARCGLKMQRVLLRAHYDPRCSALRDMKLYQRVRKLPLPDQFAVGELFRAASLMHFFIACPNERADDTYITDIQCDHWRELIPVRHPMIDIKPSHASNTGAQILSSPQHQFPDIQYSLPGRESAFFRRINGERSVGEIMTTVGLGASDDSAAQWVRNFLEDLDAHDFIWLRG